MKIGEAWTNIYMARVSLEQWALNLLDPYIKEARLNEDANSCWSLIELLRYLVSSDGQLYENIEGYLVNKEDEKALFVCGKSQYCYLITCEKEQALAVRIPSEEFADGVFSTSVCHGDRLGKLSWHHSQYGNLTFSIEHEELCNRKKTISLLDALGLLNS